MKTTSLAAVGATALLVVAATSVAILGGGSATAAGNPSRAHGLELTIAGTTAIDRMPSVVSADGAPVSDELFDADALNPLLSGGVVQVSAENGAASANVTGLGIGDGLLAMMPAEVATQVDAACTTFTDGLGAATGPLDDALQDQLLPGLQTLLDTIADASAETPLDLGLLGALDLTELTGLELSGLCDVLSGTEPLVELATVTSTCTGTAGSVDVVGDASVLGLPVTLPVTEPNAKVEVPGLVTVTANRQTSNADGTFTVDALHVDLFGQVELTVASATCGVVTRDAATDSPADDDGSDGNDGNEAPSPTPVETNAPVTG